MSTDPAREPTVRPEIVTIGNSGIERNIRMQEQQSEQRHQYNLAMTQFNSRQLKYALYVQKRKELLALEKELQIVDRKPEPAKPKKSRPQMILQDGEWIELEGVIIQE